MAEALERLLLGKVAIVPVDQHNRRSVVPGGHQSWQRLTQGLLRELNPGPLAPEARIMPLDQAAKLCSSNEET